MLTLPRSTGQSLLIGPLVGGQIDPLYEIRVEDIVDFHCATLALIDKRTGQVNQLKELAINENVECPEFSGIISIQNIYEDRFGYHIRLGVAAPRRIAVLKKEKL